MFHKTIITCIVFLFLLLPAASCFSQDIPACIADITKPGSFSKKELIGRRTVSQGRTVYAVQLIRPPRCMDCASGTLYYDSACKLAASFTIGNAPSAYISDGYSATDFIEARSPMYSSRIRIEKKVPACISSAIARPDSLLTAGISSVQEMSMNGKTVYYFQSASINKKNCADCATIFTYYDSTCSQPIRFSVGGFAGVVAPAGFTKKDYADKKLIRVLWSAPMPKKPAANPFPAPVTFTITQTYDTGINLFLKNDQLTISTAEGLYHYRDGKLLNRYKIIPQQIKQLITTTCLIPPCPVRQEEKVVYYLEPFRRYIDIRVLSDRAWFCVSKKTFDMASKEMVFKEGDWTTGYRLK